jgi:hypothetical protein
VPRNWWEEQGPKTLRWGLALTQTELAAALIDPIRIKCGPESLIVLQSIALSRLLDKESKHGPAL